MLKSVQVLSLCLLLILCFSSCVSDNESLDPEYKNKVDFVSLESGTHYIKYSGYIYSPLSEKIIYVKKLENDVFLGWNGFWWGYKNQYYSSTKDNPVFIYETRTNCLYFHETYNYSTDTFVVENTSAEIVWADIFYSQYDSFDFFEPINVTLYSKQCNRIQAQLEIICVENQWYLSLPASQNVWIPSDEFVKILLKNGIVNT